MYGMELMSLCEATDLHSSTSSSYDQVQIQDGFDCDTSGLKPLTWTVQEEYV